jgi:HEAT repeat protein
MATRGAGILVAVLVGVARAQLAPAAEAEKILEFRKYYADESPFVRVSAVRTLGVDNLEAAELIVNALGDPDWRVVRAAEEALGKFRARPVIDWLGRKAMLGNDGLLRARIATAFGEIGDPTVVPILGKMLEARQPEVRRAACHSQAKYRDGRAVPQISAIALGDKEPDVRIAALDALTAIADPKSADAVNKCLADPLWQVRSAAVKAAVACRQKSSVTTLVAEMQKVEGRLLTDFSEGLRDLTGMPWREEPERWAGWWKTNEAIFKIPTKAALEDAKRQQAAAGSEYAPPKAPKYHTVATFSEHIVFVIDASQSMGDKIVFDPKYEEEAKKKYTSRIKLDIVKQELIELIFNFKENVNFNIVPFASEVKKWEDRPVPATEGNKARAIKFLRSLEPIGMLPAGGGGGMRTRAGSGDPRAGKTNTFAGLLAGLEIPKAGMVGKVLAPSKADTMFFLSDGNPSTGDIVDRDAILVEIQRVNATRKIVIHTITFSKDNKEFMQSLALQNGGTFVAVGG